MGMWKHWGRADGRDILIRRKKVYFQYPGLWN